MTSGNREQFSLLYQQYGRLVRNFLFRLGARTQLDDLTQETFIRAWKSADQLRAPAAAKAWLLKIALHQFYDWTRANRQKFVELDEDLPAPEATRGAASFEAQVDSQIALESLPLEQRSVCVLFYLEDFSVAEIAETLNIPEGTVKTRLMKGRERMKSTLTESAPGLTTTERKTSHE